MSPQTYFLTFSTYGTWLHGDDRGSVDRAHNEPGQPTTEADPALRTYRANLMTDRPYRMDASGRQLVLDAIIGQTADAAPERVMNVLKSYATRALNDAHPADRGRTRWTRHGSTRWLRDDDAVARAVHYTLYEQGEPLAVYPTSTPDIEPEASRAATDRERLVPSAGTQAGSPAACDPPYDSDPRSSRPLSVAARGLTETP